MKATTYLLISMGLGYRTGYSKDDALNLVDDTARQIVQKSLEVAGREKKSISELLTFQGEHQPVMLRLHAMVHIMSKQVKHIAEVLDRAGYFMHKIRTGIFDDSVVYACDIPDSAKRRIALLSAHTTTLASICDEIEEYTELIEGLLSEAKSEDSAN